MANPCRSSGRRSTTRRVESRRKNGPDHQRYGASGHDSWARALCQGQGEEDLERGLRKGAKRPNGTGENVVVLHSKATSRIVSHIVSRSRRWYWNGPPSQRLLTLNVDSPTPAVHVQLSHASPSPAVCPAGDQHGWAGIALTARPLLPGPADIAEHPAGILRRILERWPPPCQGRLPRRNRSALAPVHDRRGRPCAMNLTRPGSGARSYV